MIWPPRSALAKTIGFLKSFGRIPDAYRRTYYISCGYSRSLSDNLLPIDGRAKQIARVVVIILGVISLLKYIAVF